MIKIQIFKDRGMWHLRNCGVIGNVYSWSIFNSPGRQPSSALGTDM